MSESESETLRRYTFSSYTLGWYCTHSTHMKSAAAGKRYAKHICWRGTPVARTGSDYNQVLTPLFWSQASERVLAEGRLFQTSKKTTDAVAILGHWGQPWAFFTDKTKRKEKTTIEAKSKRAATPRRAAAEIQLRHHRDARTRQPRCSFMFHFVSFAFLSCFIRFIGFIHVSLGWSARDRRRDDGEGDVIGRSFLTQSFSGSRSWRNRSRRIRIGKSNQRSVERSPHEQADSHRQELDRKVRKSPVRKSMEDGLIRLQGKINGHPALICLTVDQHMISFPLTLWKDTTCKRICQTLSWRLISQVARRRRFLELLRNQWR